MDVRRLFATALAHHRAGRLAEAEAAYRGILALSPDHVGSLQLLGALSTAKGRHNLAIELIGRALALRPDDAVAHSNLGCALQRRGRLAEAVSQFERATVLKPDYAEAFLNLGACVAEQGKLDEAASHFQKSIALNPGYTKALVYLGETRLRQGRREDAIAAAELAASFDPHPSAMSRSLGVLLFECGFIERAVHHLRQYLQYDPTDREGAGVLLARLGAEAASIRASDAQIAKLYAGRADRWDESPYHGHELVARALTGCSAATSLDIVDAGCGTGLVGQLVAPLARRLDGVDVSPEMLAKAEQKNIYSTLHCGDFIAFLNGHADRYDVVTSAATLIHFGDLRPAFEAVATALRSDGLFIFTVFPDDGEGASNVVTTLARNGCFTHSRANIANLAANTGFDIKLLETDIHEYRAEIPITGLIVALQRQKLNV